MTSKTKTRETVERLSEDVKSWTALIHDAVERTATTAEDIHNAVAELPLEVMERSGLDETARDLKKVQRETIGAVYDLVRKINRRVERYEQEVLA